MSQYLIFAIGFLAQILFSARMLVQWISSEKAGKILSPVLFWQLSILASFLLMVYGILRKDLAIILGQAVTYGIYLRNLYFQGFWSRIPVAVRIFILVFPLIACAWLLSDHSNNVHSIIGNKDVGPMLLIWGIAGQFVFTFRFLYQWLYTEKQKKSVLPIGFWLISLCGSTMVLIYAIIRKDPVLLVGQLFGTVVYSRNILIWSRTKKQLATH